MNKADKKKLSSRNKAIRNIWSKTNRAIDKKTFTRVVGAELDIKPGDTREWLDVSLTDIKQAAKKVAHTEDFVSAAERSRENLLNSLKKDFNAEYNEIRNLSRDKKGRWKSIDLAWDSARSGYTFTGRDQTFFIDVSNSPEEVHIIAI